MANEKEHKLRSFTFTNGTIKDLPTECERLKILGSVVVVQEVRLREILTHGHSSFHSHVVSDVLKSSGSCVIKGACKTKEIRHTGNLKIKNVQTTKLISSGRLTIEQILQSKQFDGVGIVQAKEIHAKNFHLKLSGESKIERLIADEIFVEKERKTISLFKKKLICKYIKARRLQLSSTDAEIVEGDNIVVGKNCHIQTLYYKENYTISPSAKVQQIIRREI